MSLIKLRIRFTNLNCCPVPSPLGAYIELHDVLHGLWDSRGVGNNSIKAKLVQQMMEMRKDVLCGIFLDLPKEFYS